MAASRYALDLQLAMQHFRSSLLLTVAIHAATFTANAQFCYPPHFGGIVPGITLDRDVRALYGEGFYSDELGHVGGRYYTDASRSVTLVVEIGVDSVIESVWLKQGLQFPATAPKDLSAFVAQRLDSTDNGHLRVGLGADREQVRKAYGQESQLLKDGTIASYRTDYRSECYIDAGVAFWFTDGKVSAVVFSNGE